MTSDLWLRTERSGVIRVDEIVHVLCDQGRLLVALATTPSGANVGLGWDVSVARYAVCDLSESVVEHQAEHRLLSRLHQLRDAGASGVVTVAQDALSVRFRGFTSEEAADVETG